MPKYNLTRKYALKQYENIDLYVEGLESIEEMKTELEKFDLLAQEYKDKPAEVSETLKVKGTKQEFILNKKDGLLYEKIKI